MYVNRYVYIKHLHTYFFIDMHHPHRDGNEFQLLFNVREKIYSIKYIAQNFQSCNTVLLQKLLPWVFAAQCTWVYFAHTVLTKAFPDFLTASDWRDRNNLSEDLAKFPPSIHCEVPICLAQFRLPEPNVGLGL